MSVLQSMRFFTLLIVWFTYIYEYLQEKSTLNWQNSIDNRDAFRQLETHQTI